MKGSGEKKREDGGIAKEAGGWGLAKEAGGWGLAKEEEELIEEGAEAHFIGGCEGLLSSHLFEGLERVEEGR